MSTLSNGQASFSPNGMKYGRYDGIHDLDIFDFDRCTGLFHNYQHVSISDDADVNGGGGLAFSSNSRYLYVSSLHHIYQFDVLASNVAASKDTVAIYDGFYSPSPLYETNFSHTQLAPNGKIYIITGIATDYLHIIHSPDSGGLGCNVEQHALQFPSYNSYMLPNFPHFRTGALLGSACDTITGQRTILQAKIENEIKLYPNPASQEVTLEWTSEETGDLNRKITIYNALGQIVYSSIIQNTTSAINSSTWTAGLYLCQLYENGVFVESKKLIIVKP